MKPPCIIDGCNDPVLARKLCSADYQRAKAAGTLDEISPNPSTVCEYEKCGKPIPPGLRWGAKFCSVSCKNAASDAKKHAALLAGRTARARFCAWCREPLTAEKRYGTRFCSRAHSDAWSNHQKALSAQRAKKAARKPCEACGGPIPENRKADAIYCTAACKRQGSMSAHSRVRGSQQESNRLRLYGIGSEEFGAKLAAQDGVCAICKTVNWGGKGNHPHVDHDHVDGSFRGILTHGCNLGLGNFHDDPMLLASAIVYLTRGNPDSLRAAAACLTEAMTGVPQTAKLLLGKRIQATEGTSI